MHVLMSFPPNDQNTPTHNPWPFPQETILNSNPLDVHGVSINNATYGLDSMFLGQELVPLGDLSICSDEALPEDEWLSQEGSNPAGRNLVLGQWRDVGAADEPGCSSGTQKRNEPDAKKHDHNAKERARRVKLNSSYLNLVALLPDFQTAKKRWTAPVIVDRAIEYIPELQNEIENLTVKKQNMLAETGNKKPGNEQSQAPNVTVHEIKRGELVLQICAHRRDRIRDYAQLASIVQNIEAEGLRILNVSTVSVPDDRFYSYQIHSQVHESSVRAHHYSTEAFRDKVISWLGNSR